MRSLRQCVSYPFLPFVLEIRSSASHPTNRQGYRNSDEDDHHFGSPKYVFLRVVVCVKYVQRLCD